jgi:hypothetical protein
LALTGLGATGLFLFEDEIKAKLQPTPRVDPLAVAPPADPPPAQPAPTPAALAKCPAGTVQVAAATLRLDQPDARQDWPPPPPGAATVKVDVEPFCIEIDQVKRGDLLSDVGLAETTKRCLEESDATWFSCLTSDEAAAFCARRWPDGRLPRIAEWEALARDQAQSSKVLGRLDDPKLEFEWLDDTFPPQVFQRPAKSGPQGRMKRSNLKGVRDRKTALHWAYNQPTKAGQKATATAFRCAASLSPTP